MPGGRLRIICFASLGFLRSRHWGLRPGHWRLRRVTWLPSVASLGPSARSLAAPPRHRGLSVRSLALRAVIVPKGRGIRCAARSLQVSHEGVRAKVTRSSGPQSTTWPALCETSTFPEQSRTPSRDRLPFPLVTATLRDGLCLRRSRPTGGVP